MNKYEHSNSIEILIGDLIFKLGKANQQLHYLTQRVAQLELHIQSHPSKTFPHTKNPTERKEMIAQ